MVASLVLTTRYRRPFAVWVGVSGAFVFHVVLAVSIGSLLRRLPEQPVQLVVAALFLVGGVVLLRGGDEDDEIEGGVAAASFRTIALTSASVVGLAEFGDLTQLATAGIATRYHATVAVALGAWFALASVAGLAVTAGSWIVRKVPLHLVQRIAGVVFIGFGVLTAITAFT
jgi:putative Ca2+/H+ antiporter (TMEM165/GDT1 family)